MAEINSKEYWNYRFEKDWEERLGRLQSVFFANCALSAFPGWLTDQIKLNKWNICDWGCALGDGTNELFRMFPENKIIGIDFSEIAIANAIEHFSKISFHCENLLKDNLLRKYEILFSSNVLEHFSNPWEILSLLHNFVKEHLVIIIPYNEFDRHEEHCYTFEASNIPSGIGDNFQLTYFEILDTAKCTPNYWGGLQVLLIYSNVEAINRFELPLLSRENILEIDKQFFGEAQLLK